VTGDKLKSFRISQGLSQTKLAEILGYHHYQRISEFERGLRVIPRRVAGFVDEIQKEKLQPGGALRRAAGNGARNQ